MKTTLRRTEPYKWLQRTTKPVRRRVLIEKSLAKNSKKQHSENTDKWHLWLCKAGSFFNTVNHCGPLPLKELHSTGETIVWRDPGGSWACLPPVYKCNLPATVRDTCGIHPKQHTKKRGVIRNTKRPKSQEEELGCGQKKCIKKTQRQAIRMKGALWNVKRSEITK